MSNPTTPFSWQMPTSTDLVTDLPADFEVFGQAVATSMADLLGGTTGQILAKASATDMDFTWIANDQGDITGVTAGTGITVTSPTGPVPTVSINTAVTADLTTAQTLTNKTLTSPALTTPTISTATTNGDILYGTGSGALARLGIGTTGQVLKVTGGIPAWATPSAGWTLITSGSLSSTTTTVSSISGAYLDLKILFIGMVPSTAGANISIKYNNTDTVYNPGLINGTGSDTFDAANAAATDNKIGNNMATTGTTNSVQILMQDYSRATGYKRAEITFWNARNTGNSHWGWYEQRAAISDAINRFDVTATAGNLSGSYFVYGLQEKS